MRAGYIMHVSSSFCFFFFIAVDKENIKPPILEGLDALVAVSCAFCVILCLIYL